MSMAFLNPGDKPLVWRGPMLNSVIQQFLRNVDWGELDYLVIDLPPGTGDVQLTLIQTTPLTGAVVVTTPSDVALEDARKAVNMFEQVREDVLGIVENMSYFEHNGEKLYIFGKGGGARTAEQMHVPLLAEIPLDPETREGGDSGQPIATRPQPNAQAALFEKLAHTIIERAEAAKQKQRPTITIAD
jgi:ATP-binding protein involved in chromosome partitioning